ncbi:hypothetical protein AgCh_021454 [Apium graveolens]
MMAVCGITVGWAHAKQNRRVVTSPRHLRCENEKGFGKRKGKIGIRQMAHIKGQEAEEPQVLLLTGQVMPRMLHTARKRVPLEHPQIFRFQLPQQVGVRGLYSIRYETIRVPILRPSEYPIWKVKMAMFLEATDPEYLDRINEGSYKPTKLSVAVADQPTKSIPKEKGDYTAEDISSIAKDARVRHLLYSAIDNVMSNRNRRTILTQEYEHFDSKADESLTDLYNRFVKLLNDLSLVDKEYDLKDSNLKFLLALPENWDLKSTTIRDNYDLTETTLDEIYGMLKTYELEMDQRSKRHGRKSRTVSLKAEEESPKLVAS